MSTETKPAEWMFDAAAETCNHVHGRLVPCDSCRVRAAIIAKHAPAQTESDAPGKLFVGDNNAQPLRPDKIQNRDFMASGGVKKGSLNNPAKQFSDTAFVPACTETKPAEWILEAAGSCARKIWPGAARDADEGKLGGIADIAELTGRIAAEFSRHAPAQAESDAVEALRKCEAALWTCKEETRRDGMHHSLEYEFDMALVHNARCDARDLLAKLNQK